MLRNEIIYPYPDAGLLDLRQWKRPKSYLLITVELTDEISWSCVCVCLRKQLK